MRKLFITLGAILAFGMARAQTDTQQPSQTQPDAGNPKQSTKTTMDAEVQNNPSGVTPNVKTVRPARKSGRTKSSQPVNSTKMDTTMSQDAKMPRKVKKA